jgi:hypothetical protein
MEEASWGTGGILCFRLVKSVFWWRIGELLLTLICTLKARHPMRLV